MTQPLNPTITITISGVEGSGKNRVLAIIEEALRYHLGRDIIIDAPALHTKRETHTDWSKPRSGTIFKPEEKEYPCNPNQLFGTTCDENQPGNKHPVTIEFLFDFISSGLTKIDPASKPFTEEMKKMVIDLLDAQKKEKEEKNKLIDRIKKECILLKKYPLRCRAITSDDLIDRSIPVHIQTLMSKLGISFEAFQEADLQPVIDLVNWALAEDTKNMPEEEPDTTIPRKHAVDKLINAMSFNGEAWSTPTAVHATIAALLTLYDQPLVLMELRKVLHSS